MPTYEYKCTVCQERFEIFQSMSDDALTSLPGEDHEHQLKKVFSPVGIAFKGSGFYKNDARSASGTSTKNGSKAPSSATRVPADAVKSSDSSESKTTDSKTSDSKTPGSKTPESSKAPSPSTKKSASAD